MKQTLSLLGILKDPVLRQMAKDVLAGEPVHIEWNENGEDAVALFRKCMADVVLLNYAPGQGKKMVRAIRDASSEAEIIVVVPGPAVDLAREAIDEGAYDFVFRTAEDIRRLPLILKRITGKRNMSKNLEQFGSELRERDQKIEERERELETSMKALASLIASARAINAYSNEGELMQHYVKLLSDNLSVTRASIMLLNRDTRELVIRASRGIPLEVVEKTRIPMGEGISGLVAKTGEPVFVRNIREDNRFQASPHQVNYTTDSFISIPVISVLAIPIKVREEVLGVINLTNKDNGQPFSYEDFNLATVITAHMASALDNINLRDRLEKGYLDTIATLIYSIEAKDPTTAGHSERVTEVSVIIAEKLELAEKNIKRIRLAGSLHDIGKIGIDESILRKQGKLTAEETKMMQRHPVIGYSILAPLEFLKDIRIWILQHHEHYAGGGYPSGKPAREMKLESRIISVADAFDAMTSDRPYRLARSVAAAIDELRRCAGTQFDPYIVEILAAALIDRNLYSVEAPSEQRRCGEAGTELRIE
jgi:HD-GYP domain-containing protein (c-di-GMP phosphodiesterase class II)